MSGRTFALRCLPKVSKRSNEELEVLAKVFAEHDIDGDGLVDMYELGTVLHAFGQTPSLPELQWIISEFDEDGDKKITIEEFMKLTETKYVDPNEVTENIRKTFRKIDENNDGEIDKRELREALANLDEKPTNEEVEAMIRVADVSKNGTIDFEEFCAILEVPPPTDQSKGSRLHRKRALGNAKWGKLRSLIKYTTHWKPTHSYADLLHAAKQKGQDVKTITFIRHGESTSNEKADQNPEEDPFDFDPVLTVKGVGQATNAREKLKDKNFELIVVSPLRRTCLTARYALENYFDRLKPLVIAKAAEELTSSDDIGSEISERENPLWAEYNWSQMPSEEIWWYVPEKYKPKEGEPPLTVAKVRELYLSDQWVEPWGLSLKRAEEFQEWLLNRPEKRICVVSHGDFIEAMTGRDLDNAAFVELEYVAESAPVAPIAD